MIVNSGGIEQLTIEQLEAERDDYKSRWEMTGCTRHGAMEVAIDLFEKASKRITGLQAENKRLHTILVDVLDCGSSLGWTKLGKYGDTGENISLREVIQNELRR